MEALINLQMAQKEIMETFIANYKKDGKDKRTQNYYEKRLRDFEALWTDFNSRHREILVKKYCVEKLTDKELAYFDDEIYLIVEEYYFKHFSVIKDRYNNEFEPKKSESVNSVQAAPIPMQETHGYSIKLPKISLEKFCGDYRKWPTFKDLFKNLVHENRTMSPVQKLQYLKLHLSGEPENLLRHLQVTDANYYSAWNLLRDRYDNKRVLVNLHLKTLLSQSIVTSESYQGVKGLLDTTTECLQALTNLKIDTSGWDPIVVYLIVQKLPIETHQLWEQEVSSTRELPTWDKLKQFLDARFRTLEAIFSRKPHTKDTSFRDNRGYDHRLKSSSQSFHITSQIMCPLCAGSHNIRQCSQFAALNTENRMEIVKGKGLCMNCLGFGHLSLNCPSKFRCQQCKRRHHSLLHRQLNDIGGRESSNHSMVHTAGTQRMQANAEPHKPAESFEPRRSNNTAMSAQVSAAIASEFTSNGDAPNHENFNSLLVSEAPTEQVLLATALVRVVSPSSGQVQIVRALYDPGSQASFITESIAQNLNLKKENVVGNIHGILNVSNQVHHRAKLIIKPVHGEEEVAISGLVVRNVTKFLPTKTIVHRNWAHIKGLELADPHFYKPGKIDVLLGADAHGQMIMDGLIRGPRGSPVAQRTCLGWILSGEIAEPQNNSVSITNFHVCTELERAINKFWELEDIQCEKIYNKEDELSEQSFINTHKRLDDGRYEVELPMKKETSSSYLGESRSIALQRLYQTENRLKRDSALQQQYNNCLKEYITLGHMVKIDTSDQNYSKIVENRVSYACSYLPHHAVIKESSTTTKLRVVFDASRATRSGVSLNDMLLKGPTVQGELASLLIRWRKHKIVFTADLEKMYRQVRVRDKHTEYQRIVWRESPELPPQDYKLLTVTFGTKSAPYLATRVLKQLALDEGTKYPLGSKITLTDFYVDDLLSGADTIDLAVKAQNEVTNLMKDGGFALRKWTSNYHELLESVPMEHRETNLPINMNGEETVRALGIFWNPQSDCFTYSIQKEMNQSIWSKRSILSEISKLFDPLGWLAPCIILAKILIQNLWLAGVSWDEEIPSDIKSQWNTYRERMKDITQIQVSRWINFSENNSNIEIHAFSDASIKAYAAVIYICTINEAGQRHVALISAKTKVAPIKVVSLPRLELCAAVLASKLLRYVMNALDINKPISLFAWTDSEIVLAWLRAHPSKWTTFIANRVSQIHHILGRNIWAHVSSKENPADCASRGMYPSDLQNHDLWWKGPKWLWKSQIHWPKHQEPINTNLEQRGICVQHRIIEEGMETRYSSLTKLLRVTAYCNRFIRNLRKPSEHRENGYLKASEIYNARIFWLKTIQRRHFENEIINLENNKCIERKSRLLKLTPFLDSQGLLRVGGRLRHSDLSYNEKHPIILPDEAYLTQLIIEKVHKDTLHGGPQLIMTVMGKHYWLLNARNTIRQLLHKCIPCYRQRATVQTQLMGDLPSPRVHISRPFAHTGVDYCGPYHLKTHKGRNPKMYKAFIALFICMSTKALHIELVTDLSAEGFIAAFRRFCSRRGLCSELYCDHGTNFVGASRLLSKQQKEMLGQMNVELAAAIESEGVKFSFIPPASPHFGGLWESGVRSTKYHLKRVIGNARLTYEEFTTVLAQIEACLNSRPLCELSSDPRDLNPLTPAHFLVGDVLLTPPEPSLLDVRLNRLDRWQFLQRIYQDFWKRWNAEYLCRLQQRPKWAGKMENVKIGDLVIIKEENIPPCRWALARVIETHPGSDGLVRVVTVKTKDTTLKRPIAKICRLPINERSRESEQF